MNFPARILIIHASVGAGHTRAAQAVGSALSDLEGDAAISLVDVLEYSSPWFRRVYADGYLKMAHHAPALFGALYALTDRVPGRFSPVDRLRRAAQRRGAAKLRDLLAEGKFDVVVHTHFLAPELIADWRRAGALRKATFRQLSVVTDFDAHRLWANSGVDRYCVAGADAAQALIQFGVRRGKIFQTGIPIDPAFAARESKAAARKALGLRAKAFVVLQVGGGEGLGPIVSLTRNLLNAREGADFVVVCGRNAKARRRVASLPVPVRHRLLTTGVTDQMRDFMAAADLIVTKPGGLTVSESLACGLPMALIQSIPGQERRNAQILIARGAAVGASKPRYLAEAVDKILSAPRELAALRERAAELGKPDSAFDVARQVLDLARKNGASAIDAALKTASVAARAAH